jgi:hypothetical protein
MPKIIRIKPYGAYGNQMFQYMLAAIVASQVPQARIIGAYMPWWKIDLREEVAPAGFVMNVNSHVIPLKTIISILSDVSDCHLNINCLSTRMAYYADHIDLCRGLFPTTDAQHTGYSDEWLVISIRLGETITTNYPFYGPLPIDWYRHLISTTKLKPIFFGQLGDDIYSRTLREEFPTAKFVSSLGPLADFNILRTSTNVCLSISTFAWLAAWLSTSTRQVFCPIYLMFHPAGRPDIDLLPTTDQRYRFYVFDKTKWNTRPDELEQLVHGKSSFQEIAPSNVAQHFPYCGSEGTGLRPVALVQ